MNMPQPPSVFYLGSYLKTPTDSILLTLCVEKDDYDNVKTITAAPEDPAKSLDVWQYGLTASETLRLGAFLGTKYKSPSSSGVFQTIDDVAKGEIRNKIRDLLGAFMFGGPEESMKKVKVLSGGERTRLAMIKLLLEPVNLLILDEPTNHLDMKTKDILKQALLDFDGTLILVSHDRDFLDGLVSKVYEFGNKQVKEHLSGIYEFLEKKKMDSLRELER